MGVGSWRPHKQIMHYRRGYYRRKSEAAYILNKPDSVIFSLLLRPPPGYAAHVTSTGDNATSIVNVGSPQHWQVRFRSVWSSNWELTDFT